ncbi:hypothetical protein SD77_3423 [Bacillus badius]|uniref:Uncharacterized protein n=1 Tax=Bacillus badius TaxID=1455 RepID=A0ABR5AQ74_BACBA|nr:hypothetical protein SD77_3423 [Bacillus badius]KIL74861.1 hypothetical protein SD78_1930 [Bacillus badius]
METLKNHRKISKEYPTDGWQRSPAYELKRDRDKDAEACGNISLFEIHPLKKDRSCPFSIFFSRFNIKN